MPSRVDFTKALRVDKVCPLWLVLCPVGGKGQSERSVRERRDWFLFGYAGSSILSLYGKWYMMSFF